MKTLSIYIHIPFCRAKCNYCSFYSIPIGRVSKDYEYPSLSQNYFYEYPKLIKSEIESIITQYPICNSEIKSIYFGGGTPSIMPIDFFEKTLKIVDKNFTILSRAEITVEVNPESADLEKLKALHQAGINRLSIGIQSFDDTVLKSAGRIHNRQDIYVSIGNARTAGFKNISADIILGLPGQSEEILHEDIKSIKETNPEHISAYMLSMEENTEFYKSAKTERNTGAPNFLPDEEIARYYEIFCEEITSSNFWQYEISNFAQKGYESRHNLNYWKRGEYLGLGPSASSFLRVKSDRNNTDENNENAKDTASLKEVRKTNVPNLKKYSENISSLQKASNPYSFYEILTEKDRINEEIFLSLRTSKGINAKRLYKLTNQKIIDTLINKGLMRHENGNIALTIKGMLLSSEIIARIMV